MGVSATVVRELRAAGHDATHLEELGLRTLPDADIFRMAREQSRIVLTFDLDFTDIVAATMPRFRASSSFTCALVVQPELWNAFWPSCHPRRRHLKKGRWLSSMKAEFESAHCRSSIKLEQLG